MTRKSKNSLKIFLSIIFFFGALSLWQNYFSQIWWSLFVLIILIAILPSFIVALIPDKKRSNKAPNKKSSQNKNEKRSTYSGPKKAHNLLRSEKEILTLPLNDLSWREFERLCFLYYKAKGYNPRETSEGADGGVDLIIYDKHHAADVAIQIKHWKSGKQISVNEIRELVAAKRNHKCVLAQFITTSSYTKQALLEAQNYKIETLDITWIENKILSWRDQEVKKRKHG